MSKPNIILIILDTARAHNLSCYGYSRLTTPYLDSLCNDAHRFTNAFTPGIWTIPSHASLFTGTYPSKHGALNLHRYLNADYTTIAQLLASHSYETAAFSNNFFLSVEDFGLNRGFQKIEGKQHRNDFLSRLLHKGMRLLTGSQDSGAAYTNNSIRRWIRHGRDFDRPFFLFANYMEAHAPYINLPRKYIAKFLSKDEVERLSSINQDRQKYLTRSITMTDDDFRILRSVYDAQIAYLDQTIRNLMEILKANNLFEQSLIIITSDHGDLIGEHGLMHHSYCVYEELIKIPLIVKLPGSCSNGKDYNHLVSLIDIYPTISEILNIKDDSSLRQVQGESLYSRKSEDEREHVFVECEKPKNEFKDTYPGFDFSVYDRQLLAIRSHNYKYIWASDGKHELYDLTHDPAELDNIIATKPDLVSELESRLFTWYNSFEKSSNKTSPEDSIDNEIREQLKGLGYF